MTPDAGQLPAPIDSVEAMLLLTDCRPGSYGLALLHAWDMLASPAATGQQTVKTAR